MEKFFLLVFLLFFMSVSTCPVHGQDVGNGTRGFSADPIVGQEGITVPENYQQMLIVNAFATPSRLFVTVPVESEGGKTEKYYRPLDAVLFKQVDLEKGQHVFKWFIKNSEKIKPFRFYLGPSNGYSIDMVIIKNLSVSELCGLDLLEFPLSKNVPCRWSDQLPAPGIFDFMLQK